MGRTVLPFSRVIEGEYEAWKKFRRALPVNISGVLMPSSTLPDFMWPNAATSPGPSPWRPF